MVRTVAYEDNRKILFVPVSGPQGMGEFARTRAVADALVAEWPQAQPYFLLHRDASYASGLKYPVIRLPKSPTLCSPEVIGAIESLQPRVVWFDNAGRTDQLRAARAAEARVIYVSSRARQRYKAFRLRWLKLLDHHWISYPAALAGELGRFESWKLRFARGAQARFLDAVLAPFEHASIDAALGDFRPELVVVPGGGSGFHDSSMRPERFAEWAAAIAAAGRRVVFVAGPSFKTPLVENQNFRVLRNLAGGALMSLLARTRLVLVNGGDTLVQAIVLGKACVAVPIAGDQPARIARCVELGVALAPAPDAVQQTCANLLSDDALLNALEMRVAAAGWADAMPQVLNVLEDYLGFAYVRALRSSR
ncbi:MAG: hypothetical protein EBR51_08260 [Gammaproteobacteria bacterium]|jgi:hypothetical protein|nr:hypothetical protein [Gammaproteobacteria bacterium]